MRPGIEQRPQKGEDRDQQIGDQGPHEVPEALEDLLDRDGKAPDHPQRKACHAQGKGSGQQKLSHPAHHEKRKRGAGARDQHDDQPAQRGRAPLAFQAVPGLPPEVRSPPHGQIPPQNRLRKIGKRDLPGNFIINIKLLFVK